MGVAHCLLYEQSGSWWKGRYQNGDDKKPSQNGDKPNLFAQPNGNHVSVSVWISMS